FSQLPPPLWCTLFPYTTLFRSYGMLLIIGFFSYLIVQLEYWELAGGPALWLVCLLIFIISWIGQFIGHKIEGKRPSFLISLKFFLIGPIWLLTKVYKRVRIPS